MDPKTHAFLNRRVFAYVDTGVADGVQLDTNGNVYAGCGDGVQVGDRFPACRFHSLMSVCRLAQVWNPDGDLIGKFFLGTTSANMIFAGNGRLVIMAETAIYLAQIAANGFDLSFPGK